MDFSQALAIWVIWTEMNSIREHGAAPEEVFVPFNLPPVKPEPMEEAKPAVAVPASSSEASPVGV
jgi:hypothetical protein